MVTRCWILVWVIPLYIMSLGKLFTASVTKQYNLVPAKLMTDDALWFGM